MNTAEFINHADGGTFVGNFRCVLCGREESEVAMKCIECGGELTLDAPLPGSSILGDPEGDSIDLGLEKLSVHRVLSKYVSTCNITFSLGSNKLPVEQIFNPEALMPIISVEALRIWQIISHRQGFPLDAVDTMQIEFRQVSNTYFPIAAYPVGIGSDIASSFRLLAFLLATRHVFGLRENSKIDLLPFLNVWSQINWDSEDLPEIPLPSVFDPAFRLSEFIDRTTEQSSPLSDRPDKSAGLINEQSH
jgi:hypothetical protein